MNAQEAQDLLSGTEGCAAASRLLKDAGACDVQIHIDQRDSLRRVGLSWAWTGEAAPLRRLASSAGLRGLLGALGKDAPPPDRVGVRVARRGVEEAWLDSQKGETLWRVRCRADGGSRALPIRRSPFDARTRGGLQPRSGGGALRPEEELARTLAAAHRLHPIRETLWEGRRATFVFLRPVPWPFFLRLDLAAPFAREAAGLSYRLGRREIAALSLGAGTIGVSIC